MRDVARSSGLVSGDTTAEGFGDLASLKPFYYVDLESVSFGTTERSPSGLERGLDVDSELGSNASTAFGAIAGGVTGRSLAGASDTGASCGHDGVSVPPPPSSVNPYRLIQTKTYLRDDVHGDTAFFGDDSHGHLRMDDKEELQQRPFGAPPRAVPRALFEDGGKRTYEVQ